MFFAEIWRERCLIITLKNSDGEFLFLLLSKVMATLVKRMHVLPTLKVKLRVKTKPDK